MPAVHLPVVTNERPDICGPCGGRCCARGPGFAAAADFGDSTEVIGREVRRRLRTGKWKVCVFDEERWMRPAFSNDKKDPVGNDDVEFAWLPHPCVLWTERGCTLVYERRPAQCREMVPNPGKCAVGEVRLKEIIDTWIPYRDLLDDAVREIRAELTAKRKRARDMRKARKALITAVTVGFLAALLVDATGCAGLLAYLSTYHVVYPATHRKAKPSQQ